VVFSKKDRVVDVDASGDDLFLQVSVFRMKVFLNDVSECLKAEGSRCKQYTHRFLLK